MDTKRTKVHDIPALMADLRGGMSLLVAGEKYGVSRQRISQIMHKNGINRTDPKTRTKRVPKPSPFSPEQAAEILRLYAEDLTLSITDLARTYNVSPDAVSKLLRNHSVKTRAAHNAALHEEVCKLRRQRMSYGDIGKIVGTGSPQVCTICKRYGLTGPEWQAVRPPRACPLRERDEALAEAVRNGMTPKEAAQKFEISREYVYGILIARGVRMRELNKHDYTERDAEICRLRRTKMSCREIGLVVDLSQAMVYRVCELNGLVGPEHSAKSGQKTQKKEEK
jgi:transposase